MLLTLYVTGSRVAGLTKLNLGDAGDGWLDVSGKGGRRRRVAVPPWLTQELRGLVEGEDPATPIFRSLYGHRLSTRAIRKIVARCGSFVANRRVSPMHFRHSHITHALDAGLPVHVVARSVGHASLHTTSVYAHAAPGDASSTHVAGIVAALL